MFHKLSLSLLLLLSISAQSVSVSNITTPSQIVHYWNLFKLRNVFLNIKFSTKSEGVFLKFEDNDHKLEYRFENNYLILNFPQQGNWQKKISINMESITRQGDDIDLVILIDENMILAFESCKKIFSDQVQNLDFMLSNPKIQILDEWSGPVPVFYRIDSGNPILQKCKTVLINYCESFTEEIETGRFPENLEIFETIDMKNDIPIPKGINGCMINDNFVNVGESKVTNCTTCTCVGINEVTCRVKDCPYSNCEHYVTRPGECCPSCAHSCFMKDNATSHPHGEVFWPDECYRCKCWDGSVKCKYMNVSCQTPNCPRDDWINGGTHNCCPKCRDNADYCHLNPCDTHANCYNEKRGPKCVCKEGFHGNGTTCVDIDECQFSIDVKLQLGGCMDGTICKNTLGSFQCTCLPGFQRLTENTCIPLLRV